MKRKYKQQQKSVGYGYVGEWSDGKLGWFLPTHMSGNQTKTRFNADPATRHPGWSNIGETSYLCRITIVRLKNSKGKFIVRKVK